MTTVNIEGPYERIIEKIIKNGYAGNKTEVVRQALRAYERQLNEENEAEIKRVSKKVDNIVAGIESGKRKSYAWDEVKKELDLE